MEEKILTALEKIENKMDEMQDKMDNMQDQINGMQDQINGMQNQINGMQNQMDDMNQRLDKLEEEIKEVQGQQFVFEHEYGTKIEAIFDAVTMELDKNLEKSRKIRKLDNRMDRCETNIFSHERRISSLELNQ